jgi:hypothetical protein
LGQTYCQAGQSDKGEKLLRQVLADQRVLLGRRDPDTLTTMAVLANVCKEKGGFIEAEGLLK